jgi:hypothetical protein
MARRIVLVPRARVEYSDAVMRPAQHKGQGGPSAEVRLLCTNRKARHDYHVEETYEAGIALLGSEVKSIRQGRANLRDGYAAFERGELFLSTATSARTRRPAGSTRTRYPASS